MQGPAIVVMAAGMGSRYGGLKQIDPIGPCGEIVIDYSIHDALAAGFGRAVIVIRKEIEEAFREEIGRRLESKIDVTYVHQALDLLPAGFSVPTGRKKPWGTGHAVLSCKPALSEPFAVINADDFYGARSFHVLAAHLKGLKGRHGDHALVGFDLGNTLSEHGHVARGFCRSHDGYLAEIVERTRVERHGSRIEYSEDDGKSFEEAPASTLVSMNMWGFTPSFLDELEARFPKFLTASAANPRAEFYIPSVVSELLEAGKARVKMLTTPERWVGVTYKEDLPSVKKTILRLIAEGHYERYLWGAPASGSST